MIYRRRVHQSELDDGAAAESGPLLVHRHQTVAVYAAYLPAAFRRHRHPTHVCNGRSLHRNAARFTSTSLLFTAKIVLIVGLQQSIKTL